MILVQSVFSSLTACRRFEISERTAYFTFKSINSASYYSSYAQTAIGVQEAPASTPEPPTAPLSVTDQYFVPAVAGIIVAIIVVGLVLALLVRRRP